MNRSPEYLYLPEQSDLELQNSDIMTSKSRS